MTYLFVTKSYLTYVVLAHSDEVEFEVGTDTRTGKLIARRVVRLPTGTVSFESISEDRLLGKVDCEPKIISGISPSDNSRRGSKVSVHCIASL